MIALQTLRDAIAQEEYQNIGTEYRIPALWLHAGDTEQERVRVVKAIPFFLEGIDAILSLPDASPVRQASGGEWTKGAVVYNMFTRLTTAWDHDGDGNVGIEDLPGGLRETGTFLKSIAMLPHIRSLGCNTIHLLPITAIGKDGNKGTLGSPYAIRNPYELDQRLAEPFHGLGAEAEFAAFVEAAHRLGMRVVMEFVFRTASKDSDWIPEHPNWFYWIDEAIPDRDGGAGHEDGYGNPRFSSEELNVINLRVKRNDTSSLPPPGMAYRQMFRSAPEEVVKEGDRYIGILGDGTRVRIPGAFADWPPDDVQPPWNDVTYLKLFDHPGFNYIAYNTIRIYDSRLATVEHENRGLWNNIINIIPHFQKNFGIDGVMIDMGHALPKRLKQSMVERARKIDPDFAFWEENFAISVKSRQEGYNATVGYLWSDEHIPAKLREFLHMLQSQDVPVPFFATPETHNTPRAATRPGGLHFSRLVTAVNAFLPAVPFIHQGFELGETFPVNTGLGFTPEDIAALPSHTLPLFSQSALCWDNGGQISDYIARVMTLREAWSDVIVNPSARSIQVLECGNPSLLCFLRMSPARDRTLAIVANMDVHAGAHVALSLDTDFTVLKDELSGAESTRGDGGFHFDLAPGQVLVFELRKPHTQIEEFPVEGHG
ncbi:MAG: alpha-amylase [Bacteroidia bacterium]|nr:alpha-amylase [Bacteroidia bacterium]